MINTKRVFRSQPFTDAAAVLLLKFHALYLLACKAILFDLLVSGFSLLTSFMLLGFIRFFTENAESIITDVRGGIPVNLAENNITESATA